LSLCNITLLEEVLNLCEKEYYKFCEVLLCLWDELPERMYSDELENNVI